MSEEAKPLDGKVALVAGATRAGGRGIALELAAAGAKVYCTGRSTWGHPATPGRPETIEETADLIAAAGGSAVAVRVDHTVEAQVEALAARIAADEGRLDVLVNDIWGGDELIDWSAKFWALDMATVRTVVEQAVLSHLITSRYFAPMMVQARQGLIVEITDGALGGYRGHLLYDFAKASANRLAYDMAWDLAATGVTALAVSPGFLRSEAMLERFGVTEANWRDAAETHTDFGFSETPRYMGRAVAALAADAKVRRKSGGAFFVGDLADEYGFTDVDGAQPHFERSVAAWLDAAMAGGAELTPQARNMAAFNYLRMHTTPAHADRARLLADRLGFRGLPPALAPVG